MSSFNDSDNIYYKPLFIYLCNLSELFEHSRALLLLTGAIKCQYMGCQKVISKTFPFMTTLYHFCWEIMKLSMDLFNYCRKSQHYNLYSDLFVTL